jgi:hypothetical protein
MPEPLLFSEWKPDLSDRENPAAEAKGCISQAGQYAPFPDIQDYGPAATISPNMIVYLPMDGADGGTVFPDYAPVPHTFTAAGNAHTDTAQSVFGGASMLCDGTGDWITTPDAANLSLGTACTVELRQKINAATGTREALAGQADSTLDPTLSAWYLERHTDDTIRLHVSNGVAFTTLASSSTFVTGANFVHVEWVLSGGTLHLFIDGTEEDSAAFAGAINNSAAALRIGAAGEDTTDPWTGWVEEFVMWSVALHTANFTPPTNPYHFGAGAEDVVLGADTFYDSDTAPAIFYGDAARLYRLVSRMAVDVSLAGGYSLGSSDTWQFAQFGDNVVAVARAEDPQHYVIGTSVDFANLAGTPPSGATCVARVNDFLMLGKEFTVHWSAFNDIEDYTPDPATQAGNQELDQERGEIISIVGLDYAAIFQERGIRRAIYVGPPVIWDFGQDYIEKARGCIARNAAVAFGRIVFYAADDGFYAFDGQSSTPIGHGKIDNYFSRNLNYAYRHKISVGIDYQRKLVVWACPMGSNQLPSELLIYSVQDGRWTHDVIDVEFLFDSPAEPFTVDNFDTLFPADDLDGTISPDDIDSSVFDDRRVRLAAFHTGDHQLGMFTGAARQAIIETRENELAPGTRALLTEVWPLGDFQPGEVAASIGYRRALPGAAKVYTGASQMNRAGFCPQRIDARFGSVRLQVSAGATWRRGEGVHVTAIQTGKR